MDGNSQMVSADEPLRPEIVSDLMILSAMVSQALLTTMYILRDHGEGWVTDSMLLGMAQGDDGALVVCTRVSISFEMTRWDGQKVKVGIRKITIKQIKDSLRDFAFIRDLAKDLYFSATPV